MISCMKVCACVSAYPSFVVSATAAMSCTVLGLWWIWVCSPRYFWTKSPGVMNLSPSLSATLAYWGEKQKTSRTTTALVALTLPKLMACLVSVQRHEFGAWQSMWPPVNHRSAVLRCITLLRVQIIKFNFEISTSQKHQLCNPSFTKLCT